MSAAALSAHRQSSESDSTQSRPLRDVQRSSPLHGVHCREQTPRIRGRSKHSLPCEP